MYTQSYLRYFLGDEASLKFYYVYRRPVTLVDIKRNLMLVERGNNLHIPDHYYRLGQERSFQDIEYISELFTKGLRKLADNYLELRNGTIYVKAEMMNSWQLMMPNMPTLLMDCVKLWSEYPLEDGREMEYINSHFLQNIAFTTYPSPYIPQLNELLKERGLTDLHMHLNGALETDLTWQDFLKNPLEIKNELEKAFANEKVKEHYAQTAILNEPERLYELLKVASVLRYLLFSYAYEKELPDNFESFEQLLQELADGEIMGGFYPNHPLELMVGRDIEAHYLEGILYVKILQLMCNERENDTISRLFHYYLLILGLTNKMLVQQPTCYGFEEFQKITLNGLREYSESRNYFKRFTQLSGNQLRHVRLLEGRFSPKDEQSKNEEMLGNILEGWDELKKLQAKKGIQESTLRLVAHFIKKKEGKRDAQVRYRDLRDDVEHRSELLIQLLHDNTTLSKVVLGIDAAASEFDTPPEVFAKAYRRLREKGYQHFTYHAGEDFYHIISGLRAIYEAITYLDLHRGDRIGHATAAGLPVSLWRNNIGTKMLIRQGEHLDNMIFAYHLISQKGDEEMKSLLPMLSLRIDELGFEVYQEYKPVSMHIKAWHMRYEDPRDIVNDAKQENNEAEKLYLRYHQADVAGRYDKIIEVETYDLIQEEQLSKLQLMLLEEMHRREIVIETLPTSNVVIGNHHDFSTYHLYNWYQWKKQGKPLPPIVIGTDDIGIFATNIYNEYCNIFCQFVYCKDMNADEVSEFIKELDENARLYGFE